MNCRFCGAQLTGTEVTCPTCGNAVNANYQDVNGVGSVVGAAPVNGTSQVMQTAGIPEMPVQTGAPEVTTTPQAVGAVNQMPVDPNQMAQSLGNAVPMGDAQNPYMAQNVATPQGQVQAQVMPTPIDPATVAMSSGAMGSVPMGDAQNPMMGQSTPQTQPMPTPIDPATVAMSSNGGVPIVGANDVSQQNPMMGMNNPMQTPVMPQTTQTDTTNQQKPPKNTRLRILLIILAIVTVGTIGYYAYLFSTGEFSDGGSSGGNGGAAVSDDEGDEEGEEESESIETYAGYKFAIPDGYTAQTSQNGLLVTSYDTAYLIAVDYTNNYEGYQSYFATTYPEQANTLNNKFSNRDYLIANYQGSDGTYGTRYVSTASDSHLFVGVVLKTGGVATVPNDFADLSSILDGATIDSEKAVAAGDELDAGKAGAYLAMPLASEVTFNTD